MGEPLPPPPSGIDREAFRAWLEDAGAEGMMEEFFQTFGRDAPGRLDALERAVGAGDARAIERAAHAYRSSAATIHALALAGGLGRVELAAAAARLDDAQRALAEVRAEHARVLASLSP